MYSGSGPNSFSGIGTATSDGSRWRTVEKSESVVPVNYSETISGETMPTTWSMLRAGSNAFGIELFGRSEPK